MDVEHVSPVWDVVAGQDLAGQAVRRMSHHISDKGGDAFILRPQRCRGRPCNVEGIPSSGMSGYSAAIWSDYRPSGFLEPFFHK